MDLPYPPAPSPAPARLEARGEVAEWMRRELRRDIIANIRWAVIVVGTIMVAGCVGFLAAVVTR